jgi:hypothetical protein
MIVDLYMVPFKSKYMSPVVSETTTRPTAPMSPLKSIESPSHSTSTFVRLTFSESTKGNLELEPEEGLIF